ncbi:putative T7SS-secreted protein [Streptomyces angustmyceticus]|uniref:putative T7SS-secreted protein n=1 Tax=Streptomyces angustmyceticus TaxID=285578 RepID=UPI0036BC9FC1
MTEELGETKDPKGLIPGNVGDVEGVARALKKQSGKFETVAHELGAVRISGWNGPASERFWEKISGEKRNWLYASDALSDAAAAVSRYATALGAAQGQAREAIALWDDGNESQAQLILRTARQHVRDEADAAAEKLDDAAGGASDAPSWLQRAGKTAEQQKESGKTSLTLKDLYESNPLAEQHQKFYGSSKRDPDAAPVDPQAKKPRAFEAKLWERKAEVNAWEKEAEGESQFGDDGKISGKAGLKLLGAEGTAGASVKDGRFQVGAGGKAYLAQASAEGGVEYGPAAARGDATAFAGAEAQVTTSVGKDGVHAGAEAFAGAKATASGHVDVGGIGAGATAEGWAGAGAAAHADAGMKDGKFVIGGDVGVGLGLGGKVGFQAEIDPEKVVDTVSDIGDKVGDGIGALGDGLESINPFG